VRGEDGAKRAGELVGPKAVALPVSIDFLGRPFSEPLLIRIAAAYEKATGTAGRRRTSGRGGGAVIRWRDEMTRAASDPALAREYVRRISMIASLKKAALLLVLLAVLPLTLFAKAFRRARSRSSFPTPPAARPISCRAPLRR